MTSKPVAPSIAAREDVRQAVIHYRDRAGASLAIRFIDEVARIYDLIGTTPQTGSLRYAFELEIEGLRFRRLRRFPFPFSTSNALTWWTCCASSTARGMCRHGFGPTAIRRPASPTPTRALNLPHVSARSPRHPRRKLPRMVPGDRPSRAPAL